SRRRHTRFSPDWSSDVCSSDLQTWRTNKHRKGTNGQTNEQSNKRIKQTGKKRTVNAGQTDEQQADEQANERTERKTNGQTDRIYYIRRTRKQTDKQTTEQTNTNGYCESVRRSDSLSQRKRNFAERPKARIAGRMFEPPGT